MYHAMVYQLYKGCYIPKTIGTLSALTLLCHLSSFARYIQLNQLSTSYTSPQDALIILSNSGVPHPDTGSHPFTALQPALGITDDGRPERDSP